MLLRDLKKTIVDLKRSEWNKETSKPEQGMYDFKPGGKVYMQPSDYTRDSEHIPEHVLKFVAYDDKDDFGRFIWYKQKFGAEPVVVGDRYWPEPLKPTAENTYTFGDTILMKIPTEVWVDKRVADVKRFDDGHKLVDAEFNAKTKAAGVDYDVSV